MLFKNNKNTDKVTDFIENNEANMANKENSSKNRKEIIKNMNLVSL